MSASAAQNTARSGGQMKPIISKRRSSFVVVRVSCFIADSLLIRLLGRAVKSFLQLFSTCVVRKPCANSCGRRIVAVNLTSRAALTPPPHKGHTSSQGLASPSRRFLPLLLSCHPSELSSFSLSSGLPFSFLLQSAAFTTFTRRVLLISIHHENANAPSQNHPQQQLI